MLPTLGAAEKKLVPARNHRSVTTVAYRARTYLSLPLDLLRSRARYSQAGATSEAAAFILPGGLCCKLLIVVSCRTMGARQEARAR